MALEKFKVKGSPLKYKFLSSAIGAGFITLIVVVANLDLLTQTEEHSEKAQSYWYFQLLDLDNKILLQA